MKVTHKAAVIEDVASALIRNDAQLARRIASEKYPWTHVAVHKRKMNNLKALSVFIRDGFIDRYSGSRLVFPGALYILSMEMPDAFPAHKTWRVADSHVVYWELWPAVDHIVPVSRGGVDDESNYMTTSVFHNTAKGHWTIEELGWPILAEGDIHEWDGLTNWFLDYIAFKPSLLDNKTINNWHDAVTKMVGKGMLPRITARTEMPNMCRQ